MISRVCRPPTRAERSASTSAGSVMLVRIWDSTPQSVARQGMQPLPRIGQVNRGADVVSFSDSQSVADNSKTPASGGTVGGQSVTPTQYKLSLYCASRWRSVEVRSCQRQ